MDLTVKQLKDMLEGGFISFDNYLDALMELRFSECNRANEQIKDCNNKQNPAWFDSFKKFKKSHPGYGGGEHEVPYEAGFADGVRKTAEMYRPSIDRTIELVEYRIDKIAMSYHKSTNAIYMKIRKAINAIENGKPEKAEIILLRMIKDAT